MAEILRAAAVGAAFVLVFAIAELWKRYRNPPVEWTRKFVHFTGGVLVLAFPWVFTSRWTVLLLAAVFAAILWGTRRLGLLDSVHGVARDSEGGLFYPLAIVILFTIAHDQPVFYLVAALTLVVSDTVAALLGTTYGRLMYTVEADRRSIEGSAAFFITTFLAVHLPLLLMTGIERPVSVLVAVQVALVVTLFEGVSLHGSDNLLAPLTAFYMLVTLTPESSAAVAIHLSVLVAVILALSALALVTGLLRASGVMLAALFFYGVFLFGGAGWMAAPVLAVLGLAALRAGRRDSISLPPADYQVASAFYVTFVPLLVLVAKAVMPWLEAAPPWLADPDTFRPLFIGAMTAQGAIVAITQVKPFVPGSPTPPPLPVAFGLAGAAYLLVAPAGMWLAGGVSATGLASAAAIPAVAVLLYWLIRRSDRWSPVPPWNLRLQCTAVAAATLLLLPVHLALAAG